MIKPKNISNLPLHIRKQFEFDNLARKIDGLTIIIPIKGVDRANNLNFCINRMLLQNVSPIEIIISEYDNTQKVTVERVGKDPRLKKIFTKALNNNFNKSIAVNVAVMSAKYAKILMNDADIIVPKGYLLRVDDALKKYDTCFFAKTIYNVHLMRSGLHWAGSKREDYFTGGSIAFTKDAYLKIGGMCELFDGYGSEDCEFFDRVRSSTNLCEQRDATLLHLSHKRATAYSINAELYQKLIETDLETRIRNLQKDLDKRRI